MPIEICKASAGSGKTHKLTGDFLRLTLPRPELFSHILAVTFTNKATEEMKTRIVDELFRLWKTPDQSPHYPTLAAQLATHGLSITEQARKALSLILFNYSEFNVTTIDSFFQQTLRSFIRELGLQANYAIEFDTTKVLSSAIDQLYLSLENDRNQSLYKWLLEYYRRCIEEGKSWEIKRNIAKLGEQLFREGYREAAAQAESESHRIESLNSYLFQMRTVRRTLVRDAVASAHLILQELTDDGLSDEDFHGSRGRKHIIRLRALSEDDSFEFTPSFRNCVETLEGWTTQKAPRKEQADTFVARNQHRLNQIIITSSRLCEIDTILSNIYLVGILAYIHNEIDNYCAENNTMILSRGAQLLQDIIDGSSTPFIYEKIATYIQHYMIDEFQDTSNLQWANFLPLIRESVDGGFENLIVGDVKQSIYRWRNSNFQILEHDVATQFDKPDDDYTTLDDNRRSTENIITFNNHFFTFARKFLAEHIGSKENPYYRSIESTYTDVAQNIPPDAHKPGGFVDLRLLSSDADETNESEEEQPEGSPYQKIALRELIDTIYRLDEQGIRGGQIGILVRENGEAGLVVQQLLLEQSRSNRPELFQVVSTDGAMLTRSAAVNYLVALLYFLCSPLTRSQSLYVDPQGTIRQAAIDASHLLKQQPLFELTNRLIDLYVRPAFPKEEAFIQAFVDHLYQYLQSDLPTLSAFLNHWENYKHRLTVSMPESPNAISILTIHKSKGLAFDAVLIPFANWEFDIKFSPIEWLYPTADYLPKAPTGMAIPLTAKLRDTHFGDHYLNEQYLSYMDNLNLLYVAFTRARRALIVFAPQMVEDEKKGGYKMPQGKKCPAQYLIRSYFDVPVPLDGLSSWALPPIASVRPILPSSEEVQSGFVRAENKGSLFADPATEEINRIHINLFRTRSARKTEEQIEGILLHELFSTIHTSDDIETAILQIGRRNMLPADKLDLLKTKVLRMLDTCTTQAWFTDRYEVRLEAEILRPDGSVYRPDRVMIAPDHTVVVDYKFGTTRLKSHHRQVNKYVELLRNMGYPQVSGYLWYVQLDAIEMV